jgi:hypothetical protein
MASQQSKILVKHRTEARLAERLWTACLWQSQKCFQSEPACWPLDHTQKIPRSARRGSLRSNYESLNTATARIGEAVPSRHLSGRPMN